MYTTPEIYPIWKTKKPVLICKNSPFRYRYLQFSGGSFQSFEYIDKPREFTPLPRHVFFLLI